MRKAEKKVGGRLQELQNLQRAGWVLDPQEKAELATLEREDKKPASKDK